jgi:hypothetical protein
LERLPLVPPRQVHTAEAGLAAHGAAAYLLQPWGGVPFKVWALVGGGMGLDPKLVIPAFILARAARLALVALAARAVALRFGGALRRHFGPAVVLYLAAATALWWRLVS